MMMWWVLIGICLVFIALSVPALAHAVGDPVFGQTYYQQDPNEA